MAKRMNNTGSIFYRKDRKRWIYEIPEHLQAIAGKKIFSSLTQRELKIKIEDLLKKQNDINISISKMTIQDILKKNELDKLKKNIISNQSYGRNKHTIAIIENSNLGNKPIQNITINDIDDFSYFVTKYAQSTIDKVFSNLKRAFEIALDNNIIYKNIISNYKKPISSQKTKKVSAFTVEEQKEFIKLIPNSIYYMQYMIGMNTGLRMGEINALHIKDIDFKNKTIFVNKTVSRDANYKDFINDKTKTKNGTRLVPINHILMPYLVNFCKNKTGYLFSEKRIISTGMVNSEMKRLCEKSEIIKRPVNTHMLRHTFATRCIESGMQAVVLSKLLGHADISTTLNVYTDVFNSFKEDSFNKASKYFDQLYN